ncbi:MAG: hypothetical protein FJZ10_02935 [Candidatus Omnitrophica bacterium]|nr:hypothetical protein [Candidatus Omnitrophota bacterium]
MSKRLIIIIAVAFVLGLAVSAHAAVQNVKVSGDLKVSAIGRSGFDLGDADGEDESNVIMSQTRVRIDTDLTENVSATVRLLNERDWGKEVQTSTNVDVAGGASLSENGQDDNEVDIDLASLTMKEMFDSPVSVTLGRQELMWGAGFVLGDSDTNRTSLTNYGAGYAAIANRDLSLRKAFDAVKVNLDYDPLMIEAFYSKIDENQKTGAQLEDKNDIDLYGAKASYALGDKWGTMLETYLLYRNDKTPTSGSINATPDTLWCPGIRAVAAPMKDMIVTAEMAWQTGSKAVTAAGPSRSREAMAYQVTGSYALPFEKLKKYSPSIGAHMSYYSGDKNPADGTDGRGEYRAWDQLYENQGTGKIYNVLFDATNTRAFGFNASAVPMEDLSVKLEYTDVYLAVEPPGTHGVSVLTIYGIDGNSRTPVMTGDNQHLGREFDLSAVYDYTEDVQFGLTYGAFIPGAAFDQDHNHEVATQLIGTCAVSF